MSQNFAPPAGFVGRTNASDAFGTQFDYVFPGIPGNEAALLQALGGGGGLPPVLFLDGERRVQYQTQQDVGGVNLMSSEIPIRRIDDNVIVGLLHLHFAQNREAISHASIKTDWQGGFQYRVYPDHWPDLLQRQIY